MSPRAAQARAVYEAACKISGLGDCPYWEELPVHEREGWATIAKAGVEASPELAEARAQLGKVRELAESWTEADGWGDLTREMQIEAECGRQVLAELGVKPEAAEAVSQP